MTHFYSSTHNPRGRVTKALLALAYEDGTVEHLALEGGSLSDVRLEWSNDGYATRCRVMVEFYPELATWRPGSAPTTGEIEARREIEQSSESKELRS